MKIRVTGDMRTIANSAWISTLDEIRAAARSDDEVRRVVKFLIGNQHTSPLESVTLSFDFTNVESVQLIKYIDNGYSRWQTIEVDFNTLSIDLLNFVKMTVINDLFEKEPWQLLKHVSPELSEFCSKFQLLGGKKNTPPADIVLGDHGMAVELVNFHNEKYLELSRATWRIKCPLSIAVQILRHRKMSPNMASGRYRVLHQDMINPVKDCSELFERIGEDLKEYLDLVEPLIERYESMMLKAKAAKDQDILSNKEYKRIREFARFILPEGRMTELYVTYYLDDFYNNYLVLRDSEDAQTEHIWIAQEMNKTLEREYEKDL